MTDSVPLPAGWVFATLGEVTATKVKQDTPDATSDWTYIDISSVDNTAKSITEPKGFRGSDLPSRARQWVEPGDYEAVCGSSQLTLFF